MQTSKQGLTELLPTTLLASAKLCRGIVLASTRATKALPLRSRYKQSGGNWNRFFKVWVKVDKSKLSPKPLNP